MSRIGIVAVSTPRLGGTFQYSLSMIEALRSIEENEYIIFTTSDNDHYNDLGLPISRLPHRIPAALGYLGAKIGLGRQSGLFTSVEKVIAPIYTPYLLASARPFAFTLHDLQEKYFPRYFTLAQRLWRDSMNSLLTRAASKVICESRYVKADITSFYPQARDNVVVLPAPPLKAFKSDAISPDNLAAIRAKLQLPEQYIFYPAQFFPHKNHRRLVEAFARVLADHPNCQLLLTGKKIHEYDRVMSQVIRSGLNSNVRHIGFVSVDELAAVYKLATLVVIPTLFESISIPIYEAFALGTPVCTSNVVSLPEQVGDAAVVFDPLSVANMATCISATLADATLREVLVARGRLRLLQSLSMPQYASALRDLLGQMSA